MFCENGHDQKTLQKIITLKRKHIINNNDNNTDKKETITFPWIPKIGPKIKKEIQKFGFRVAFQTGSTLKNILCKSKDKLIPNTN